MYVSGKIGQAMLPCTVGVQGKVFTHNTSEPTQKHPAIDKLINLRSRPACTGKRTLKLQ